MHGETVKKTTYFQSGTANVGPLYTPNPPGMPPRMQYGAYPSVSVFHAKHRFVLHFSFNCRLTVSLLVWPGLFLLHACMTGLRYFTSSISSFLETVYAAAPHKQVAIFFFHDCDTHCSLTAYKRQSLHILSAI